MYFALSVLTVKSWIVKLRVLLNTHFQTCTTFLAMFSIAYILLLRKCNEVYGICLSFFLNTKLLCTMQLTYFTIVLAITLNLLLIFLFFHRLHFEHFTIHTRFDLEDLFLALIKNRLPSSNYKLISHFQWCSPVDLNIFCFRFSSSIPNYQRYNEAHSLFSSVKRAGYLRPLGWEHLL